VVLEGWFGLVWFWWCFGGVYKFGSVWCWLQGFLLYPGEAPSATGVQTLTMTPLSDVCYIQVRRHHWLPLIRSTVAARVLAISR
jgi:hypothetical protein